MTEQTKSHGILILEGMTVGVLDGDLTVSIDNSGSVNAQAIISTTYNVLPIWLRIAYDNLEATKHASDDIKANWSENTELQTSLLLAELMPCMQVFVSCCIALDAIFAQLKPFAKIDTDILTAWQNNKTGRAAQIAETFQRVYKLNPEQLKAFKVNLTSIFQYRNWAVHPSHHIQQTKTRPDIPVGVDWRFSAFRYSNAIICYTNTMNMLVHLYYKKSGVAKVDENMENIFKRLRELKLVKVKK